MGPLPDWQTLAERESPPPVRPASVLLETARPDLAAVVEQALTDVLPDRMRTERIHGVEALDLDRPRTAGPLCQENRPSWHLGRAVAAC